MNATGSASGTPETLDLDICEREPIRIPGSIQPYGALLVLEPASLRVVQCAAGAAEHRLLGGNPLGRALPDLLPADATHLLDGLADHLPAQGGVHLGMVPAEPFPYHLIAHRTEDAVIVELEQSISRAPLSFDAIYPQVRAFMEAVQRTPSIDMLTALAAREVRRMTGLDRALVYRFDDEWNGAVIAEDRNDALPSYRDLHFPASDIPSQARDLYRLNRLRLIPDCDYTPTPLLPTINPLTGRPTDLSFAVLRSVSPVHLQYMRNMGTAASMSISLLREDRLWGLIACHNRVPARVPYHVRAACDFVGQVLSMQLAAKEASAQSDRRSLLRSVYLRLLAHMAGAEHFIDGLIEDQRDLLALTGSRGAAVVAGGVFTLVGETPDEQEVRRLVEWLAAQQRGDVFVTDSLAGMMPNGEALKDRASGVLGISISQIHDSYVLWFRPEAIRTVSWGGDPTRHADPEPGGPRLHPRRSFATWLETVRLRSLPWAAPEIDAAVELRTAIVDIVLRKAEEMAALSERLVLINKELEAFSYSVSHDLRAPFRHIVGYAQLLKKFEGEKLTDRGKRFIDTIVESAFSAGQLVDDLLSFSQMSRATLTPLLIDMNALVEDVRKRLVVEQTEHQVEWRIAPLAPVRADPLMMRLVIQNLLENAIKFSRHREPAIISIECSDNKTETIYCVRDNGTGFDMAYVGKLFGVFQRLHRVEEFEGTGIGLANVKRIIERHRGRVWAEGKLDEGAAFHFALPAAGTG